jgi:hypothetical protein
MKKVTVTLFFVGLVLAVGPVFGARVSTSLTQPASVFVSHTASGCTNNPGPFITLNGEIRLGGVNARVILTNNAKWTHVAYDDFIAETVLIPAGESIQIAKQPSRGGVGGNPHIYAQFKGSDGDNLSGFIYLGRCVQGLRDAALNFFLPTDVDLQVTGACENNPGPFIRLDGDLLLGGLDERLIFTNNAKFTHVTSSDTVVNVNLIEDGEITFHKQPSLGGAGGNPWVYIQFLNGSGEVLGAPFMLGRCNKL